MLIKNWIKGHKILSVIITLIVSGVIEYLLWIQISKEAYDIQYQIITQAIPTYDGFASWTALNSIFVGLLIFLILWISSSKRQKVEIDCKE